MSLKVPEDPQILDEIKDLVNRCGGQRDSLLSDLVAQMITTSLKLLHGHDLAEVKLMTRALKEMRHAFYVFNAYPDLRKVSIFGSARTLNHHPDYVRAKQFSEAMSKEGWMCITGGAHGIMKAGLEGQEIDSRFGLSIRLPFESNVNELLEGDRKALMFRYFFTRKLMFMTHADALVAFPGGVGTMDELFEGLTLMQTGKGAILPIVLLQGEGSTYWDEWEAFVKKTMLANGMIDEADLSFYHHATGVEDAVHNLKHFYYRYHSNRYVNDLLVIRMQSSLTLEQVAQLNEQFKDIVAKGEIIQTPALPEEMELQGLPRLVFEHTRRKFGRLRQLIDAINNF